MLRELTANGSSPKPQGLVTRLLTPLVKGGGQRLLRWQPQGSVLIELPNGHQVRFGHADGGDEPFLKLNNYAAITRSLRRGPIGFADAYLDGDVECSDLTGLFLFFLRNRHALKSSSRGLFKVRLGDRLAHRARRNTRSGSRRNIADHYDLGNAFYQTWLDADLVYSSGFYETGAETLEAAQAAKFELIRQQLTLAPGEQILEIGCGWGGFALSAARDHGARVTGITLSQQQLAHARMRAEDAGLAETCQFLLQDYRDTTGLFDHIVSIEMIEAVGEQHWPAFFGAVHDRLKPGGTAVIQAITIADWLFDYYRSKTDFIQRYIFPGGMLPTTQIIAEQARDAGLRLESSRQFGACYARTLREWRARFEARWPEIAALGFDERFRRKWLYYLCYCEAGFIDGTIDVGVYRLVRPARDRSDAILTC